MRPVMLRDELFAAGVTPSRLKAEVRARRWRALGPFVVVRHNGPLTREDQLWAGVLHCGPGAALCAWTGAELAGLSGWSSPAVHVLVQKSHHVPPLPGVSLRVHESRRFAASDVHPALEPPRMRLARCVVDAAAWTANPRSACGIVAAAVQQRLVQPASLREELAAAGAVRHAALLRAALVDIEGGAQALSEVEFVSFCRRHRLPRPVLQAVRLDPQGRRRYLDATLKGRDGRIWRVEIDGALHLLAATYWGDMRRGNDLVIAGERVLRFPSIAMRVDPHRMVEQLRRALDLSADEAAMTA